MAEKIIEVFDTVEDAVDAGMMWGGTFIPIAKEAIDLLLEGKVLKTTVCDEYMAIIAQEGVDQMPEGVLVDG